jgi:hypothetical protein
MLFGLITYVSCIDYKNEMIKFVIDISRVRINFLLARLIKIKIFLLFRFNRTIQPCLMSYQLKQIKKIT